MVIWFEVTGQCDGFSDSKLLDVCRGESVSSNSPVLKTNQQPVKIHKGYHLKYLVVSLVSPIHH